MSELCDMEADQLYTQFDSEKETCRERPIVLQGKLVVGYLGEINLTETTAYVPLRGVPDVARNPTLVCSGTDFRTSWVQAIRVRRVLIRSIV